MTGSQKSMETKDRGNGGPDTQPPGEETHWDEELIRRYLPEFCSLEIQAPRQDLFGSLDTDLPWITVEARGARGGQKPDPDSPPGAATSGSSDDFLAGAAVGRQTAAAVAPRRDRSRTDSPPPDAPKEPTDMAEADPEDGTVESPESSAVSWEYVEAGPALAAGSTQEVRCLRSENPPADSVEPGPPPTGPARSDAATAAGDLHPLERSATGPGASPASGSASESQDTVGTAADVDPQAASLESVQAEPASEEPSWKEPADGADGDDPESAPLELTDALGSTAEAPSAEVGHAKRASEPETDPGSSEPHKRPEPPAMPAAAGNAATGEQIEESAPLELTDAVIPSAGSTAAEKIDRAKEDPPQPSPPVLTAAAESPAASSEPPAAEARSDRDTDVREGLKALFAGAARAAKEKDYPTAITCLERFVSQSPDDRRGHYHLAVLQCRAGNYTDARQSAERAAELGAEGAPKLLQKIARKIKAAQNRAARRAKPQENTAGAGTGGPSDAAAPPAAAKAQSDADDRPPTDPIAEAAADAPNGSSAGKSEPKAETAATGQSGGGSANAEPLPEFPTLDLDESGANGNQAEPTVKSSDAVDKTVKPLSGQRPPQTRTAPGVGPEDAGDETAVASQPDSRPSAVQTGRPPADSPSPEARTSREDASLKAMFARAMEASGRKDYQEAARLFEKFISASPEPAKGYYNLAILHYRRKDFEAARKYAELSVQNGVDAAHKILAKIGRPQQTADGAVKSGSAAVQTSTPEPGIETAETRKAAASDASEKSPIEAFIAEPETAAADAQTAKKPPAAAAEPNPAAQQNTAATGRAAQAGSTAPAPTADELNTLFARGMEASARKDYPAAISQFDRFVAANPEEPKGHFNLAILHYRMQDYAAARTCAEQALKLGVNAAGTILKKIERKTAVKDAGRQNESRTHATPAAAADAQIQSSESEPEESTEDLAAHFLEHIQTPQSIPPTEEPAGAGAMQPAEVEDPPPSGNEPPGRTLENRNRGDHEAVQAAPPVAGKSPRAAQTSGGPAFRNAGQQPETDSEGLFARGMKASRRKDYASAIECFKRFTALKPKEPRGHHNLAILHFRQRDFAAARICAEKAIELGLKSARQILESIDAKEHRKTSAEAGESSEPETRTASRETPAARPESATAEDSGSQMQLYDVQELDTEDFDTSAFLKNESIVWDADEMEDAFDGGQPAAAEENEYAFEDDIIVFDSPKEEAAAKSPAAKNTQSRAVGNAAAEAPEGPSADSATTKAAASTPASPSGDDKETDRCFRLGKEAIGRKDYLQAVKYFTRVAELNPDDPRAFFQLAVISFRMQYFETSREHAERALNLGYKPAQKLLETIQERAQAS